MKIKCDKCGKTFKPGHDITGIPNGIGLQLKDGKVINICRSCVTIFGMLSEDGKKRFFESMGVEYK